MHRLAALLALFLAGCFLPVEPTVPVLPPPPPPVAPQPPPPIPTPPPAPTPPPPTSATVAEFLSRIVPGDTEAQVRGKVGVEPFEATDVPPRLLRWALVVDGQRFNVYAVFDGNGRAVDEGFSRVEVIGP